MKECQECKFLNLSRAYVCLCCAALLSTNSRQRARGITPYLYIGPIATCLLDNYFPPEQQAEYLDRALISLEDETDYVASLNFSGCEKEADNLRRALKRYLFLLNEALEEGQTWPIEEWQSWLEECDEVEDDLVASVDLVEAAGHPAPLLVFLAPLS